MFPSDFVKLDRAFRIFFGAAVLLIWCSCTWFSKLQNLQVSACFVGTCMEQSVPASLRLHQAVVRLRRKVVSSAHASRSGSEAFRIRNMHSQLYLSVTDDGYVFVDDKPHHGNLFTFLPGTGPFTGYVRLHHLKTDRGVFATKDGLLGCYHGIAMEHHWQLIATFAGAFALLNFVSQLRLFSSKDGRFSLYGGEVCEDQLWQCESPCGRVLEFEPSEGVAYGIQDSGFGWHDDGNFNEKYIVYTDAFHASRYAFLPVKFKDGSSQHQLQELRGPGPFTLAWGRAVDLYISSMRHPHEWAVRNIPLLSRLCEAGLISVDHHLNTAYTVQDFHHSSFVGSGLVPSGAIKFALQPVSDRKKVPYEHNWVRTWHGAPLYAIEGIATEGLKVNKKDIIFTSPSFLYTFCLYSVPDLIVDSARFRLVIEARVKPGSFFEHGDHYGFGRWGQRDDYDLWVLQDVERSIPANRMEWEMKGNPEDIQVVGLVLKQVHPDHPSISHDTNMRHACQNLLPLEEENDVESGKVTHPFE